MLPDCGSGIRENGKKKRKRREKTFFSIYHPRFSDRTDSGGISSSAKHVAFVRVPIQALASLTGQPL
jgi:hypothetical protein